MSLINQVLSDLEKRGANARPGEASIRVVPVQRNRPRPVWLLVAVLTLGVVAAGLWWSSLQPRTAAPSGAPVAAVSALQAPAKPAAVLQAESHPVAAPAQEVTQEDSRQQDGGEAAGSAMRLSFELSSVPLPSNLRAKPAAAATGQDSGKTAPPAHAIPAKDSFAGDLQPAEGRPRSSPPAGASVPAVVPAGKVDKQIKQVSVQQQADNEFRRASGLLQQGRINEALAGYEAALQLDAGHDDARRTMVGLLLENKRNADAERVLQDGLKHNPKHSGFAMLLARLQVERNELALALETLQRTLPYADPQPDYQAFVAALLQRQGRHKEAITHYQIALQLSPDSGIWLMGLGISLQAVQRNEEARDAFRRAIESRSLSAELQAFVAQRLKEL
ncbi:MAG: tetratricopeptide repeat protein [Betaproteobacteria bacterium]|nr:tetratricopeptide repeat protein [Betaproteobacteria bacterium]